MKRYFTLIFILTIIAFQTCSKDDNPVDSDTILTNRNFTGTANTKIQYYEFDVNTGQDIFVEEKNYQYNVFVYTKSPVNVGSVSETNSLNLAIYPDRNTTTDEEGHIDICSAFILNDPTIGEVLLQYWDLNINGSNISGTLTDNHIAEASAINLIWAWEEISSSIKMTMPFPIAVNTTIQGTISANQIQLKIIGQSHNTYRRFTSDIVAAIGN